MTETRAEKAQRLVDEGHVHIQITGEHGTRAYVFGSSNTYCTILYPNGHYWCECAWGDHHSHTDDLCAHALAVQLAALKESP